MAYFREATPHRPAYFSKHESDLYDLEDAVEIIGEHSEVLEVQDKWAVVSVADYSRGIVFKGKIRRGTLDPVRKMSDYLRPGFNVVINVRRVKRGDTEAKRQQCGWVVTKIDREELILPIPSYYKDPANLFDFMGKGGKRGNSASARRNNTDQLGEWTGEAVQILRGYLKSWNGISLVGLLQNLCNATPIVQDGLDSTDALNCFVKSQPHFFTLTSQGFVYLNSGHEINCIEEEIKRRLPKLDVGYFGDRATIIRKPWHVAGVIKQIIQDVDVKAVAFDTERASNGNSEYLSTVQIAVIDDNSPHAFIFDVIDWSAKNFKTSKLRQLLESQHILKVVHDCRGDSAVLETYGIELENVFDTAVAYTTIMEQSNAGYAPPRNISHLCEVFGRFTPQRNAKVVYQRNRNFWAERPLTQSMIDHAASDVLGLATHVYENIRSFMNPAWKSRFEAMCIKSLGH